MDAIGKLGINIPYLLAQLINFAILFAALDYFAYKPLMKILDTRSAKVKDSMEQAEAIRAKAAHAEEDMKKQLEAASREAQERVARAARMGEDAKIKAQQEAKQEAEALVTRARGDIQRERDEAIAELRRAFADLTILAAGKVIDRSLDKTAHRDLIDKVLEESSTFK